jgi:uncharacterized protein YifE (UPF0438 family)
MELGFPIGGGIAGDFHLCGSNVVPRYGNAMNTFLSYFCQISDSTTSFLFWSSSK